MALRISSLLGQIILPVLTTIYFIAALRLAPPWEDGHITPSFFPIMLSVLMYAGLIALAWQGRSAPNADGQPATRNYDPLKIALLTAVYIAAFKSGGYLITTFIYVFGLLYIFRYTVNNWLKSIAFSLIVTGVFYAFFSFGFNIRLPKFLGVI